MADATGASGTGNEPETVENEPPSDEEEESNDEATESVQGQNEGGNKDALSPGGSRPPEVRDFLGRD